MKKYLFFIFISSFSALFTLNTPVKDLNEDKEILVIEDDIKSFVDENHCQVVVKDFKTGKLAHYSSFSNPSHSDVLDISYPYFEQMKKRSCSPQGSCVELDETTLAKGYVFFNQKGIIDVETAKKFNQSHNGGS